MFYNLRARLAEKFVFFLRIFQPKHVVSDGCFEQPKNMFKLIYHMTSRLGLK